MYREWQPPRTGERLIVCGIRYAKAFVGSVEWRDDESRHVVHVRWENGGTSRVYDHDEGDTWFRYGSAN